MHLIDRTGKKSVAQRMNDALLYHISFEVSSSKRSNDTDCNYVHICDFFSYSMALYVLVVFSLLLYSMLLLTIKIQLHDKCCVNTSMFNSFSLSILHRTVLSDELQRKKSAHRFSFFFFFFDRPTDQATVVDTAGNCSVRSTNAMPFLPSANCDWQLVERQPLLWIVFFKFETLSG